MEGSQLHRYAGSYVASVICAFGVHIVIGDGSAGVYHQYRVSGIVGPCSYGSGHAVGSGES